MNDGRWYDVIARLAISRPDDLSDLTSEAGVARAVQPRHPAGRAPSARLWARGEKDETHIGIRVREAASIEPATAMRLAATAIERGVIPVILSHVLDSGLERFGFRVELVCGATDEERAACESELCRFWDMPIVIDLADIGALH